MVAESNPARRHHRRPQRATDAAEPATSSGASSGNSTLSPRPRRRRAALIGLAAAAAVAVVAAPLAANAGAVLEPEFPFVSVHDSGVSLISSGSSSEGTAAAAQERAGQAAPTDEGGIAVHVAPTIGTTLTPGAPVTVSVEIENATAESLAAATVRLTRSADAIDEVAELDAWVAAAAGDEAGSPDASDAAEVVLGEAEARTLSAGSATSVSFTLPPTSLDGVTESPIIGLGAELLVDGVVVAAGADVFANTNAPAGAPFSLALAYPLTVPADATGLLDAEQLQTWTSPLGLLTRQLDAVAGRSVAIAVDPRIIASIRALGTAAPATATAWLDRLRGVPNEVFPLAYADSDLAVQAQLGLTGILSPTSFSDAMDPANFTGGDGDQGAGDAEAQGEGDDAGDTQGDGETDVTAEPSPPPGEVPTTEDLLDWPYTRSDLAWPADDTVAAGDLEFLQAAGLTTTILAPGNVEPAAEGANAASTINGSSAVVSHERLTAPLRAASVAATDTEWRSATGRLVAELALGAGERTEPTTVLATFDRGTGVQASRVSATIDELATIRWSQPVGLSAAIGAPPADRALASLPESDARRSNIDRMVRTEAEIAAFATVLTDERLLSGPTRRNLLALLDVSWIDEEEAWHGAVGDWLLAQRDTLGAVSVVPGSPINVVSSETGVPTTVLNALPYPVTIVVDVDPSNGRLIVGDRVEATIEAESRSTVRVPVAAGVGSGEVSLAVSLSSPTGVPIGTPVLIPANVQADWEGLGAAVLGIVVVLVFGIGIWRNISRRRRQRAAAAQSDAAAGATETEAGADVSDDASDASMPPAASESDSTVSNPDVTTGAPASEQRND
ncbi:DUF6049 family protein [Agromyces albus]|uniref:DUF6049 family protein n=1 Tax=Agromyces albus TaxID=205332 RepID=UPI00278058BF|nr:DUF6049 family protein [Agromyces albus]MDQ0577347.1 hypothetical protein [Agromyces albus]